MICKLAICERRAREMFATGRDVLAEKEVCMVDIVNVDTLDAHT